MATVLIAETDPHTFPKLSFQQVATIVGSLLYMLCIGCGPSVHQMRTLETFSSSTNALGKFIEDEVPTIAQAARHLEMTAIALDPSVFPFTNEKLGVEDIEKGIQNERYGLDVFRAGAATFRAFGMVGKYIAHDDPEGASTYFDSMVALILMKLRDSMWPPPNFHSVNAKKLGLPAPPLKFSEKDLDLALEKYRDEIKTKLQNEFFEWSRKERLHNYAAKAQDFFGDTSDELGAVLKGLAKRLDNGALSVRRRTWEVIANASSSEASRMVAVERYLKTLQITELSRKFTEGSTIVLKQLEAASHGLQDLEKTNYSMEDVDRFIDRMNDTTKRIEKLASIAKRIAVMLSPII